MQSPHKRIPAHPSPQGDFSPIREAEEPTRESSKSRQKFPAGV